MIGQWEGERQSKNACDCFRPILDLKAYDAATTGTPRMKLRELSENQNQHGRSKY